MPLLQFDYDGVIVDSLDQLLSAARKAMAGSNAVRVPTRADFETIEDLTATALAARLGLPERDIRGYALRMLTVLHRDSYTPPVFPGMGTVLRTLAQRHTLVVVTSNLTHVVRRVLSEGQLDGCISMILDAMRPGTKSDKIRLALKQFNAKPADSIMIGDTRGDIRHGKAAGVGTVAVTWGYHKRQALAQEKPDHLVDKPEELLRVLDGFA